MMQFALLGSSWVLWLLVLLSIGCGAVSIERWIYIGRNKSPFGAVEQAIDTFLENGNRDELRQKMTASGGLEARVLISGLAYFEQGPEAAERAMASVTSVERLRMERGLAFLATVGSNAPFVGLFGTVLGIIKAFHELSINTADASEAVMAGISEALVATAAGLLVAIPAVVLYNLFARTVKRRMVRASSLAELLLASLHGRESVHGK